MNEEIVDLIERFAAASRKHYDATMEGDYETANQQADHVHETFLKLREKGTEAREALLGIGTEGDDAAAVMAATYSLKYAPDRSLRALKRLSADSGILGFQASEAIKRWKAGEWRLE